MTFVNTVKIVFPVFFTITRYILSILSIWVAIKATYFLYKKHKHIPIKLTAGSIVMTEITIILLLATIYLFTWGSGIPITQILGFDPVLEVKNGIQSLNAMFAGTNLINLIIFLWLLSYINNG